VWAVRTPPPAPGTGRRLGVFLRAAASAAVAQLGEPVQDFTVVNENGTLTALSGLLQTKKAVLLHFFAGWLDEDYSDLPAVQAAYAHGLLDKEAAKDFIKKGGRTECGC